MLTLKLENLDEGESLKFISPEAQSLTLLNLTHKSSPSKQSYSDNLSIETMSNYLKDKYLSEPVGAKMSNYICFCEDCERFNPATECMRLVRLDTHAESVGQILLSCPDFVTLLVGPSEVKLTAHKALLAFVSDFFDAALYGNFKEGQSSLIRLPEETPARIAAFLAWAYSGHIETSVCAFELWILGDRLGCPLISNEAMHLVFSTYGRDTRYIGARAADLAYNHTPSDSKLRRFVHDYVEVHGPLCKAAIQYESEYNNLTYEQDWRTLVEGGGDLVVHITLGNGIRNEIYGRFDNGEQPYRPEYQDNYLVDEPMKDVEKFIVAKMRAG
ncbi:hypothetical protein VTL71DRAFT_8176 [Oculimacula yallundae]|uniref:BTB domain-containing protein n=1 Tax=Oculimacula yallundae TaxID=86028 RepID=A0ABR4CX53_9HELO